VVGGGQPINQLLDKNKKSFYNPQKKKKGTGEVATKWGPQARVTQAEKKKGGGGGGSSRETQTNPQTPGSQEPKVFWQLKTKKASGERGPLVGKLGGLKPRMGGGIKGEGVGVEKGWESKGEMGGI